MRQIHKLSGRSISLIWAVLFLLFLQSPLLAAPFNCSITLMADTKALGILNGDAPPNGDTFRIECVATAGHAISVDLSLLGLGFVNLTDVGPSSGLRLFRYDSGNMGFRTYATNDFRPNIINNTENSTSQPSAGIPVNLNRPFGGNGQFAAVWDIDIGQPNPMAGIGDAIRFKCFCPNSNVSAGTTPYVDLGPWGRLTLLQTSGNYYEGVFNVTAGSRNNDIITPIFFDEINSAQPYAAGQFTLDNVRPQPTTAGIVFNPPRTVFLRGDNLRYYVTFQDADRSTLSVKSILTNLLLSDVTINGENGGAGSGRYDFDIDLSTLSVDQSAVSFSVEGTDKAGNKNGTILSATINIDTKLPVFDSVTAAINGGPTWARVGNVIRVTTLIKEYDNDILYVQPQDFAAYSAYFPRRRMNLLGSPVKGAPATYFYEYSVPTSAAGMIKDENFRFSVTAFDNNEVVGGCNTATQDTDQPIKIDTQDPIYNVQPTCTIAENFGFKLDQVAVVGDELTISCQLTIVNAGGSATVDLSSINGPTDLRMTTSNNTNYTAKYIIPAGTLNDMPNPALSYSRVFGVKAYDAAGNTVYDSTTPAIGVNNERPVAPPMTVRPITDVNKAGVINWGTTATRDTWEFIIYTSGTDWASTATFTGDLAALGSTINNLVWQSGSDRYYVSCTTAAAAAEYINYAFYAKVADSAGNLSLTNSTSPTFTVDCKPTQLSNAEVTLNGVAPGATWAKVGDRLVFSVEVVDPDNSSPRLNLGDIGGSNSQIMYDDGSNGDDNPGDGKYMFAYRLASGSYEAAKTFAISHTDDAGNLVTINTNTMNIDNKPIQVATFLAVMITKNSNGVLDLDGTAGPESVRLEVTTRAGTTDDYAPPFSIRANVSRIVQPSATYPDPANDPLITTDAGLDRVYKKTYILEEGDANRETVIFSVTIYDAHGNLTFATATPQIIVDNKKPTISNITASIITDALQPNEANASDVVRFSVQVIDNDGNKPKIDFSAVEADNNGVMTSTLVEMNAGINNFYTYDWTVPKGIGKKVYALPILVEDQSNNLTTGTFPNLALFSKYPTLQTFPQTLCELWVDQNANRIANPPDVARGIAGDQVRVTAVLDSATRIAPLNSPPVIVVADIRSIKADGTDTHYDDGNPNTHWIMLTNQAPGNVDLYSNTFVAEVNSGDFSNASFPYKILHPDNPNIVLASGSIRCDAGNPFGIDTKVPVIYDWGMKIAQENGDNLASDVANIDDVVSIYAKVRDYSDNIAPGSYSVYIYKNSVGAANLITNLPLTWTPGTEDYAATFTIQASGISPWNQEFKVDTGDKIAARIAVTDDALNYKEQDFTSTFKVDNAPPVVNAINWVYSVDNAMLVDYANLGIDGAGNIASDRFRLQVVMGENGANTVKRSIVDLTAIEGSSTWQLTFAGATGNTQDFLLATAGIRLNLFTFPITLYDNAGNKTVTTKDLWVDTERPNLASATYNGEELRLQFSELINVSDAVVAVKPKIENIRLGSNKDLTNGNQIILDPNNVDPALKDTLLNTGNSTLIRIRLSSSNRAKIADWNVDTMWIGLGENDSGKLVSTFHDIAGNPMFSQPLNPASYTVGKDFTSMYPKLIAGNYYGTGPNKGKLRLEFDRPMDLPTLTNTTMELLSVVSDTTFDNYDNNYQRRYTPKTAYLDAVGVHPTNQIVEITMGTLAQDWIAMKYRHISRFIKVGIAEPKLNTPPNPPFMRDVKGFKTSEVPFVAPLSITMIPYELPFSMQNPILKFANDKVTLEITPNDRVRLFQDDFDIFSPATPVNKTIPNTDLSKVKIYRNVDRTGPFINLAQAGADSTRLTGVVPTDNTYICAANNPIKITLHPNEIKELLSWRTNQFYIVVESGAFRDLWDNYNSNYDNGLMARTLPIDVAGAAIVTNPAIVAFAVTDKSPMPDRIRGGRRYEVELTNGEIATTTYTISVPLLQPVASPTLQVKDEISNTVVDIPVFLGWRERTVNSKPRYIAVFENNGSFTMSLASNTLLLQVAPNMFEDVLGHKSIGVAVNTGNLISEQTDSGTGYTLAPRVLTVDNVNPQVFGATGPATIGRKDAGQVKVTLTFNEPLDTARTEYPTLTLKTDAAPNSTAMSFNFQSWVYGGTGLASQAVYVNSSNFTSATPQGLCFYWVSGGFDLAGNRGADEVRISSAPVMILSQGAELNAVFVQTYQTTVATIAPPIGLVTGKPFSPNYPPATATITVNYVNPMTATGTGIHWAHFYEFGTQNFYGSAPLNISEDGRTSSTTITAKSFTPNLGSTTWHFEIRIVDVNLNEGSTRGQIKYDAQDPIVNGWEVRSLDLKALPVHDGKQYFSPKIHRGLRIDINDSNLEELMYLRVTNQITTKATETYQLGGLPSVGHTINWDAKRSNGKIWAENASDTLWFYVVDEAANVGRSFLIPDQASKTIEIDNTDPKIASINFYSSINPTKSILRFNPRGGATLQVHFDKNPGDSETDPGWAFVRIRNGSTVILDNLAIVNIGGNKYGLAMPWNGTKTNVGGDALVVDGAYVFDVIDRAGNASTLTGTVNVFTAEFQMTGATQVNKTQVRAVFNQELEKTAAESPANWTLADDDSEGSNDVNILSAALQPDNKTVLLTLDKSLSQLTYTLAANIPNIITVDEVPLGAGKNEKVMNPAPADIVGPKLTKVDFVGISGAKEVNVVFDEALASATANARANYALKGATQTIDILTVTLLENGTTVRMTTGQDLIDGQNYVLTASGVTDLYANKSTTSLTFAGRDVLPPELTISAFSNPAFEYDIAILVKTNEELLRNPTCVVTQTGGRIANLTMSQGATPFFYMIGTLLDKNYPGKVTISVSASDKNGNTKTQTYQFVTAVINASIRAEITAVDGKCSAVFVPGTLKQNSFVSLVPIELEKVTTGTSASSGIKALVTQGIQSVTMNGMKLAVDGGAAAEELAPLGQAYTLNVPSGRLNGVVQVSIALPEEKARAGLGIFQLDVDGTWRFASRETKDQRMTAPATRAGSFALLRDTQAPRASLLTKVEVSKPFRDARPTFEFSVADDGAGIDETTLVAAINGEEIPVTVNAADGKIKVQPKSALLGGEHTLNLKVADKTGNMTIMPDIRFQVLPPLTVFEIANFPNPAQRRTVIRIGTNRQVAADLIEVSIYDVSGKRVKSGREMDLLTRNDGVRLIHEAVWDLTNDDGKQVANGMYLARVTVRDPENWNKKIKTTHKIAVLR
jgi:hypothetical protein